jgi:hypothetical protein
MALVAETDYRRRSDRRPRELGADDADVPGNVLRCAFGGIVGRRPELGSDLIPASGNVRRLFAVAVLIAVEAETFLCAAARIIGRIEVNYEVS